MKHATSPLSKSVPLSKPVAARQRPGSIFPIFLISLLLVSATAAVLVRTTRNNAQSTDGLRRAATSLGALSERPLAVELALRR
jgi:hypothetical protein